MPLQGKNHVTLNASSDLCMYLFCYLCTPLFTVCAQRSMRKIQNFNIKRWYKKRAKNDKQHKQTKHTQRKWHLRMQSLKKHRIPFGWLQFHPIFLMNMIFLAIFPRELAFISFPLSLCQSRNEPSAEKKNGVNTFFLRSLSCASQLFFHATKLNVCVCVNAKRLYVCLPFCTITILNEAKNQAKMSHFINACVALLI